MPRALALPVLLALLLALPGTVAASGGLFIDAVSPVAVEQNRGRILLAVHDDGTVTAAIEISYSGSPEAFAWVVPVPSEPTIEVVPPSTLRMLDAATVPRIVPPPVYGPPGNGDDDDDDDDSALEDDDDAGEPAPLDVDELPQVGPYDPTLLSSDDPDQLIDWLRDNGYLVTEEMEPYLASYVAQGMRFLGLKLAPEAGVADIQPIALTWTASEPTVPLILTGVAAEPEMGIVVFIAGGSTYEPVDHASLLLDTALLQVDPRTGVDNYHPLLSWLADQEGGQAFFTEYSDASADLGARLDLLETAASDADDARLYLDGLVDEHAWVTRLYARMSGEEMLTDPVFEAMNNQAAVAPVHDLSGRDALPADLAELPPVPCADTYCGPGGGCASTDFPGVDGCVCDDGYAVRAIARPLQPGATVTCQDTGFDLMASAAELLAEGDPCAGWECGSGSCVVVGGMAACACDSDAAGIPQGDQVTCVLAQQVYGPDQLLWPGWPDPPSPGDDDDEDEAGRATQATAAGLESGCGCVTSGERPGAAWLLLLPLIARRRRA